MCAEQAVTKVSREYRKFALKMAEMKNSMDREERLLVAREKAEKRGFEQGIEQGREQGQNDKTIEIARKMKKIGRPISEIMEITGFSPETIERIG